MAVSEAVDDIVYFTGRAPDELVAELMSTAGSGSRPIRRAR